MAGLNNIEIEILIDAYEMDINNGKTIDENNYNLVEPDSKEKRQEFASYLLKLQRFGYIEFEGKALLTGGQTNQKYRNNVIMVLGDRIHITEKGISIVEEAQKTLFAKTVDKAHGVAKDIGKTLYGEAKDILCKTLAEVLTKK